VDDFSITVTASVTVHDLAALVGQVDELVARSDEISPTEGDTFWDGSEEQEGSGYVSTSDAVWLDDDPEDMLDLAVGLSPHRAAGVDIDLDATVERSRRRRPPGAQSFTVEVVVYDAEVTAAEAASAWLGPLEDAPPEAISARAAAEILRTLAGCEVVIESAVAEPEDGASPPTDITSLVVTGRAIHRSPSGGGST